MKKTKYETLKQSTAVVVQFTKKNKDDFIYLRCWVSVESCDKKYDLSQLDEDSMVVQWLVPSPHSEKVLASF